MGCAVCKPDGLEQVAPSAWKEKEKVGEIGTWSKDLRAPSKSSRRNFSMPWANNFFQLRELDMTTWNRDSDVMGVVT